MHCFSFEFELGAATTSESTNNAHVNKFGKYPRRECAQDRFSIYCLAAGRRRRLRRTRR